MARNSNLSSESIKMPQRRQLPKLMACMTKTSLENLRNKALFGLDLLDMKGIRRKKLPLYECLILEMKEAGFSESSDYLRDLIYDNEQIMAEDDIGIVIDIKKKEAYLLEVCSSLQKAEKEREKGNTKEECVELLNLALYFAKREKGILWLSEKLFLASIAVSSKYFLDGGRQKAICKYFYAKFLLDKFPGADPEEEAFVLLTQVRDGATGKYWTLRDRIQTDTKRNMQPKDTVFGATSLQLHRVLLSKSRLQRKEDPAKAERLARLAERRARDANESIKIAEAIVEIGICQLNMNNLNNAQKTFDKACKIYMEINNIEGVCITKMHTASVFQRLRNHDEAARLLTEMGALAMKAGLRLQLGRALNLLGELHLRRERPELGTQHLAEAFSCFMGHLVTEQELIDDKDEGLVESLSNVPGVASSTMGIIYTAKADKDIYTEEAEQSRLMMAVSAGQEIMSSYFHIIREANRCAVAQLKVIEWKLDGAGWWINRVHHDYLPCLCAVHRRTPLDVVKMKKQLLQLDSQKSVYSTFSIHYADLSRVLTVSDIRNLRNSFHNRNKTKQANDDQEEVEEAGEEDNWADGDKEKITSALTAEEDIKNGDETSLVNETDIVSAVENKSKDTSIKRSKVLINEAEAF